MRYNFCVLLSKTQRIDIFLSVLFPDISRSYIQKMIDSWCVLVNTMSVKKNVKLHHKDEVFIEEIITQVDILAEDIPLDIIYEDENILIINKDAWINVHPTPGVEWKSWTLVNALLYHCKNKLPVISGEERPGIVHRLDKHTSGAIMVAKNDTMMKYLSDIIKKREVKKYYLAIVSGVLIESNFTITSDIGRSPYDRIKMTTQWGLNPKHAVTHGEVIGYIDEEYSVIKIDLETGRTHQIRVHLASIGYPIIWDEVYGNPKVNKKAATLYQVHRQQLHAYELILSLYGTKKLFRAALKKDMLRFIPEEIMQKAPFSESWEVE